MLFFKRKLNAPPGRKWFYLVPETKTYFESYRNLDEVEDKVARHYLTNHIEIPNDLHARIEDYICRNVHPSFCDGDDEGRPRTKPLSLFDIIKFSEILFNRFRASLTGKPFLVPLEQAEARAKVCLRCPQHFTEWCTVCNGLKATFAPWVANRSTSQDAALRVCGICKCVLTAKVHVRLEYLAEDADSVMRYPETCWIRNEKSNNS